MDPDQVTGNPRWASESARDPPTAAVRATEVFNPDSDKKQMTDNIGEIRGKKQMTDNIDS